MITNTWLLAICLTLALAVAATITGCERGATDAAPTEPPATATAPDAPAIPDDLPDLASPTCAPGDACATGGVELLPERKENVNMKSFRILTAPGKFYAEDMDTAQTVEIELPVGAIIIVPAVESPEAVDI